MLQMQFPRRFTLTGFPVLKVQWAVLANIRETSSSLCWQPSLWTLLLKNFW